MATYHCYWITTGRAHYIGATTNPARRLRQHNGSLVGGARRTRRCQGTWRFRCIVTGFRTWKETLQFEWAFQYHCRRRRTDAARCIALTQLLARPRWTSNAPLAAEVPLAVQWHDQDGVAVPS